MTPTPQPNPAQDPEVVYLADFEQVVNDMAMLYAFAWRALEQELGHEVASELASLLLPQIVQSAHREAMAREAQRQAQAFELRAAQQAAQQMQSRPVMPENPW